MAGPRVSVCIPVYNLEVYIAETLDSLKAQTYGDYEAIIVDDGSTDASSKIIEPYLADPRLKYVYQENAGAAAARNKALELATGEWFAQLDGDDIWMPDKLESQIALADSDPKANLIYGNAIVFRADGHESINYAEAPPEGDITPQLYVDNFIIASTVMVKTEVMRAAGGYPAQGLGEDYVLLLRLVRQGVWARACSRPIIRYRIRENSRVSARLPNLRKQIEIVSEVLRDEHRARYARVLKRSLRRLRSLEAYECARIVAKVGEGDLEKLLWQAWSIRKSDYKRFALALLCATSRITGISWGRDRVIGRLKSIQTSWEQAGQIKDAE